MGYKIKHYAQPVTTSVHTLWEVSIIELSIGLICAGMAIWAKDIVIQLAVGCAVVAGLCFLLTIQNIITIIKTIRNNKVIEAKNIEKTR